MSNSENICKHCIYFYEAPTGSTLCKANNEDKPEICNELINEIEEAKYMQLKDDN